MLSSEPHVALMQLAGGTYILREHEVDCAFLCAGAGALGMLRRFLESPGGAAAGDTPDAIGWSPLFWACNNGHGGRGFSTLINAANPTSKLTWWFAVWSGMILAL
jgi:hypothetical protein